MPLPVVLDHDPELGPRQIGIRYIAVHKDDRRVESRLGESGADDQQPEQRSGRDHAPTRASTRAARNGRIQRVEPAASRAASTWSSEARARVFSVPETTRSSVAVRSAADRMPPSDIHVAIGSSTGNPSHITGMPCSRREDTTPGRRIRRLPRSDTCNRRSALNRSGSGSCQHSAAVGPQNASPWPRSGSSERRRSAVEDLAPRNGVVRSFARRRLRETPAPSACATRNASWLSESGSGFRRVTSSSSARANELGGTTAASRSHL